MSRFYFTKRNQVWYYGVKTADNTVQWRTTRCNKRNDAVAYVRSLTQPTTDTKPSAPHMSDVLNRYIGIKSQQLKPKTMQTNTFAARQFMTLVGDKPIEQYVPEDIERFKSHWLERGVSRVTANSYYRSLKAVFSFAVRFDMLLKSPCRYVPSFNVPPQPPAYLNVDDFNRAMTFVKKETLRDIFITAFYTGMRLSELTNLKWVNVDIPRQQIVVANDADFTTKTGKMRVVPLHRNVVELLERRHRKSEYVFPKKFGYKYDRSFVSHQFKCACIAAGLNPKLHFHSLRHSTASNLVQKGVSIFEIQKILGHSSVNITANIYAHLQTSTLINSINQI